MAAAPVTDAAAVSVIFQAAGIIAN